jgi:hypothetical protein
MNNYTEKENQEMNDLIATIQDAVTALDYFSVRHDDIFNGEIGNMEEQLNNCRKKLI